MQDVQLLALVVGGALLLPVALLWIVRFAAWTLPPAKSAWTAFASGHRFGLAVFEAAVWLLLFMWSFTWTPHWSDWIIRTLDVFLAFEAISRAVRIRRTPSAATSRAVG